MTRCDSTCYFRDRGYERCDLDMEHDGDHEHGFLETWDDND